MNSINWLGSDALRLYKTSTSMSTVEDFNGRPLCWQICNDLWVCLNCTANLLTTWSLKWSLGQRTLGAAELCEIDDRVLNFFAPERNCLPLLLQCHVSMWCLRQPHAGRQFCFVHFLSVAGAASRQGRKRIGINSCKEWTNLCSFEKILVLS